MQDGYILALYRIPGTPEFQHSGQASPNAGGNSSRPAVLLLHGLLDSCAGFLLQGPDSALAFKLADAGIIHGIDHTSSTHCYDDLQVDILFPCYI